MELDDKNGKVIEGQREVRVHMETCQSSNKEAGRQTGNCGGKMVMNHLSTASHVCSATELAKWHKALQSIIDLSICH